jgi:hypothetical protein
MTRSWDWNKAQHQHILDSLQEATGVLFTLCGPFHLARGAVLEDAPGIGTRHARHEHAKQARTPRRRIWDSEAGGPSHIRAPSNAAAAFDPDCVSDAGSSNPYLQLTTS